MRAVNPLRSKRYSVTSKNPLKGSLSYGSSATLLDFIPGGGVMTIHDYGYLPPGFLKSYPVSE